MIHTAAPRSLRKGVAVVGVAGALALAGCSATAGPPSDGSGTGADSTTDSTTSTDTGSTSTSGDTYQDGTYTAEGTYVTPESVETITVTVTLEDDVVTGVDVTGDPQAHETVEYQSKFIGGISDVVVGQDLDQLSVSRVAGSSLTSGGFNDAIETIKSEAAA